MSTDDIVSLSGDEVIASAAMYLELFQLAISAMDNSYSPYSGNAVGAALLSTDETIYVGSNLELVNLGGSICAERGALVTAVFSGRRRFRAVAVSSVGGLSPCGACCEALAEFGPMDVVIGTPQSGATSYTNLAALLPAHPVLRNVSRLGT